MWETYIFFLVDRLGYAENVCQVVFIDRDNLKLLVLTVFLQDLFDSTMFGIVHHDIDFLSVIIKERNAYFPVSHMGTNHNYSFWKTTSDGSPSKGLK